ncbi:non-ribosomal peptide synthetase, partial [Marilutibacter spongiae]
EFQQGNEHGYLSLPEIQRQSGVAPGTALFDSILAFENYPLDAADEVSAMEGDARIRLESPGNDEQTSYRLSISVSVGETLQARMGYRREHFRGDMIERLQAHLARVLEQLPAAATAADIEFLSESERQLPTHAEIGARASAACAHQLFEAHAARSPGTPALWTREGVLAYGELDRRANQVAHALRQAGVRTGDVVGLCMQRSSWLSVSLLGILKAGAAYLPLDPAYPEERLRDMVDDAGLAHAILDPASLAAFPWLDAIRRLPADPAELQVALEGHAATALDPGMLGLAPDSLAYMVYTSGSTGRPKGVLLEHRGLVNLADNQQRLYGTTPESRVLGFASLSFDAAAWEWLMAFSSGACLYLADEEDRHSVDRLSALMVEQAVTHATLPPALLAHMPLERDYALQALILAGEACDERLAWRWARRYRTHNAYGPSENTVCATSTPIEPGRAIVLGEALHGVEVHLLDAAGRVVPVGIPGELHLGGIGLARGYHRRPDLTAERFIECARRPGTRLYRTGDLACRRPDGGLLFLGRLDAQVKIRGFRVEPGEIEQVLASRPGVRQALVVAHRSDEAPTRLVAYVAVDGGPGD